MGLYLRKSIKVGPLRFNLSGSGIGVSAGIPGFRVGTGPRGNYVHMGRGGLYFRQSLPSLSSHDASRPQQLPAPSLPTPTTPSVEMKEIESADVAAMVDSNSADLLQELNSKREKTQFWPIPGIGGLALAAILSVAKQPVWASFGVLALAAVATVVLYARDQVAKTTVIFYDLGSEALSAYTRVVEAFDALCAVGCIWHVSAHGDVRDRKYHAGASTLVTRSAIRPHRAGIPFVKVNIDVPAIPVGRQLLAFMPDRLLVFDTGRVGAISYSDLDFEIRQARFIEEGVVPHDAQVVDSTWKFVNKSGGPDRRFKDNPQLPIALYDEVLLRSSSGLHEMIQVSKVGLAEAFAAATKGMAHEALQSQRPQVQGRG